MQELLVLQSLWTFEGLSRPPCPPTLEARLDLIRASGFDGAGTLWLDREEARLVSARAAERARRAIAAFIAQTSASVAR